MTGPRIGIPDLRALVGETITAVDDSFEEDSVVIETASGLVLYADRPTLYGNVKTEREETP